jgi:hypothetical protein
MQYRQPMHLNEEQNHRALRRLFESLGQQAAKQAGSSQCMHCFFNEGLGASRFSPCRTG